MIIPSEFSRRKSSRRSGKINLLVLIVLLLTITATSFGREQLLETDWKPFPITPKAFKSTRYELEVEGTPVFVHKFVDIHYAHFPFPPNGAELVVETRRSFDRIQASPPQPGLPVGPGPRRFRFPMHLDKPGFTVLTMDGGDRLFLFAEQSKKVSSEGETPVVSIIDAGADPSGVLDSTQAIQSAINRAPEDGTVLIPAGHYLSGTIRLRSGMTLRFEPGALLQALPEPHAFESRQSAFLLIENCSDVTIKGAGTIDGSGAFLRHLTNASGRLLAIRNSRNIEVSDVILRNPRSWNTQILHSEHVVFDNVKVVNDPTVSNTDGINPDSSRHVTIRNSFFYCGDDAVAVKSTNYISPPADVYDILVENNLMLTHKSALKVGTETNASSIRNITFASNYVVECDRGMSLYARDGAHIENVTWRDNFFERPYRDYYQRLIHFEIKDRNGKSTVSNILIQDCSANQAWPEESEIRGLDKEHRIEGLRFENFRIGGRLVQSAKDANLRIGPHADPPQFK